MKSETRKQKKGLTRAEAIEFYDREAKKYDIKAMCTENKQMASALKRAAERFRRQRDAIARLFGVDRNGNRARSIETMMLAENGERRG